MVLPGTTLEGAIDVAKSLQLATESLAIAHARSSASQRITLSQGVVSLMPTPETTPETFIQIADQALYQAKQQGRNRYIAVTVK